jgi:hypothetical protein
MNLVIRRTLHNKTIREYYAAEPLEILADAGKQEQLFYRIFPEQVDVGKKKPKTFDWILYRASDGTKEVAPRELIQLLLTARDFQLRELELGGKEPLGEILLDSAAIKNALPEVSRTRFEQTLCAEFPQLKSWLLKLRRQKTRQTPASLASIWDVGRSEALKFANQLVDVGFFVSTGTEESPEFWVPFLYRSALEMVQGTAEIDQLDNDAS